MLFGPRSRAKPRNVATSPGRASTRSSTRSTMRAPAVITGVERKSGVVHRTGVQPAATQCFRSVGRRGSCAVHVLELAVVETRGYIDRHIHRSYRTPIPRRWGRVRSYAGDEHTVGYR